MTADFSTGTTSFSSDHGGSHAQEQQTLDVKRMLRLRAPLIIAVTLVLAIPSGIGAWFLVTPEYVATATLRFRTSAPRVLNLQQTQAQQIPYDAFVSTNMEFIRGGKILSRVLDDPEIQAMGWFTQEEDQLIFLQTNVAVRKSRNSELVSVSFHHPNASVAKAVLEKIVETYKDFAVSEEANVGSDNLQILRNERDKRELIRGNLVQQWRILKQQVGMFVDSSEVEAFRSALMMAERDNSSAKSELSILEAQRDALEAIQKAYMADPDKPIAEFHIEDRIDMDARVAAAGQAIMNADIVLERIKRNYLEGDKRIKAQQQNRDDQARQLAKIASRTRGHVITSLLYDFERDIDGQLSKIRNAEQLMKSNESRIYTYDQNAVRMANTVAELADLDMKISEGREGLKAIRDQIAQLALNSEAPARVTLEVAATVPSKPSSGRRMQFAVLAVAASIAAGVGAGLLRELTDQKLRDPRDLAAVTSLPLLAVIPHSKEERFSDDYDSRLLSADFPHSPTAEEFRRIMVRILYPPESFGYAELKTCLIASATRGDGKTSLACNVAISLAQANRRVLLLDISAREPSIEHCFGLDQGPGLAEALDGEMPVSALIRPTSLDNLSVLGPGIETQGLTRNLGSRDMVMLLEHLEEEFDHIILDSPPILLMSDARMIAPIVDGVIVVIGADSSTRGMARRCLRELQEGGADILGVVLNGIRLARGGYMRRNFELYYGYSESRTTEPTTPTPQDGPGDAHTEKTEALPMMVFAEDEETQQEDKKSDVVEL